MCQKKEKKSFEKLAIFVQTETAGIGQIQGYWWCCVARQHKTVDQVIWSQRCGAQACTDSSLAAPRCISAPWRVLEPYYFGVIVASEGIHPHHTMTETINNNHWWQCWMASAYRANPCATVCRKPLLRWCLRLRCCVINAPSGSNKNLTKSSTQSISKLEAGSHSLFFSNPPYFDVTLKFWLFFFKGCHLKKNFLISTLLSAFSQTANKKKKSLIVFFLIHDLSALIIIAHQPEVT